MFDIAYSKMVRRYREETMREADYLAKNWQGYSRQMILAYSGIPSSAPMDHGKAPSESTSEVGYKRPPQQSRFKAGQSGNPHGRPKRSMKKAQDATLDAINRRTFTTPVNIAQTGVVSQVLPLEAYYRNRQKLAFAGSVLANENAIRETRAQMEKEQQQRAERKSSILEWISKYPEILVAIHEGRLDVAHCIPHPEYYTFHDDGRITVKGPRKPEHMFYYETIKDFACYTVVRSSYDAIARRDLIFKGKHDPDYFAHYAHVQHWKTELPAHLARVVQMWEHHAETNWHSPSKLKALYKDISGEAQLPFAPEISMKVPKTELISRVRSKFRYD
ncbi:MAG: hypothetical protein RL693_215 [Verrucomicrobiota bacterium]